MPSPARIPITLALLLATLPVVPAAPAPDATAAGAPLQAPFKVLAGWPVPEAVFKAKPGHVIHYVPEKIRRLDGREVAVTGFMLPLRIHNRLVTAFMLLRTQNTCCFGIPPELHEVVEVLHVDKPTKVLMDTPITVVGRMHVHERWEETFLCSIYQLDAESVTAQ